MLDAESRRRELQGVTSYPYVGNPLIGFSSPDLGFVSDKSGPRPPRRGGSFESETGFVSDKSRPRHHDWCSITQRKKLPIVFEDEPRMNTNRHEERWTSFNDNWRQNASARRWCDPVMGGSPPGSAGVPPAPNPPAVFGHLLHPDRPAAASQGNSGNPGTGLIGPEVAARDADWESGRWAQPRPATGKIEKDYKLNMDAQDAQDNQDGTLRTKR